MNDMTPEGAPVVVEVETTGAPLSETTVVVETTAPGPTKVVVEASAAPTRHGWQSWIGWLRSLIESIVSFVKTLVPLATALA